MDERTAASRFDRHRKKSLFILAVAGTALVLVLGELLARVARPEWTPARAHRITFWTYDSLLGWAHRPGQEGEFVHRDFSVSIRINSDGLRDDEYTRDESKKTLMILGDSFAWGFGVEEHERFSEILEEGHRNWNVINAAVSGYGTAQQVLYFQERGSVYRPDLVLLLFHENDFQNNMLGSEHWHNRPYFELIDGDLELRNSPVPRTSVRQRLELFIHGRTYLISRIYRLFSRVERGVLRRAARARRWLEGREDGPRDPGRSTRYLLAQRLLEVLDEQCRAIDATFVLVSVPATSESMNPLEVFSERRGVPYLALDAAFSRVEEKTTFPHDGHWNARGHAVAARAIEGFLSAANLL